VAAFVDEVIVRMVDLTPAGAGILSPRSIEAGKQVYLLADLPMVDGVTRPVRLHLTVATCHFDHESTQGWRIGGPVVPVGDEDRETFVEYCRVVAARSRLIGTVACWHGSRCWKTRHRLLHPPLGVGRW
jgi:hypothetical protein